MLTGKVVPLSDTYSEKEESHAHNQVDIMRRAALHSKLSNKLAVNGVGEETPEERIKSEEDNKDSSPDFHLFSERFFSTLFTI